MPFCAANVEMAEADGAGGWIVLLRTNLARALEPAEESSLASTPRTSAVLVVLSPGQLRIDDVLREPQRCNGEKHWLGARSRTWKRRRHPRPPGSS
jgi:hypothetical protein